MKSLSVGDGTVELEFDTPLRIKYAARLNISVARLRGFILRNKVTDPVGTLFWVYEDTLGPIARRLATSANGARDG